MELLYQLLNGDNISEKDFEVVESKEKNSHKIMIKANQDLLLFEANLKLDFNVSKKDQFFLNGYQSWTETSEFYINYKERNILKKPRFIVEKFGLKNYGDNHIFDYDKHKLHGYDVFYEKGENELFIYNKNIENAYLLFVIDKKTKALTLYSDVENIIVHAGEELVIFDYKIFDKVEEGLKSFKKDFVSKNDKIIGYTSWYNYYQNITEDIIKRDLTGLDNRFNLFQIDDGYETFVGDWLDVDQNKFPNGLAGIVKDIHQKGLRAGLWLAPLVAEEKSKLFQEHPEYIKKDENGLPCKAGGNWSGFYALDLEKKEVLDYIKLCLETYLDMGFDFFKLDFLYASNLGFYEGKSRAMTTNQIYKFIRQCLKDKLILGCGANMLNAYGLFDYMRIGPDVSLKFDDAFIMRFLHRERISTKVTLMNTITRSLFNNHLFGNDPDVFLLRDDNISMSQENRFALITINALFGSLMMSSDNFNDYDEKKNNTLDYALDLFKKAHDVEFDIDGKYVYISYTLEDQKYNIVYNNKKGVIYDAK